MVVCELCGAVPPEEPEMLPLTWSTSVENGERRVYCDRCSREYLRSIEAKLNSEWW